MHTAKFSSWSLVAALSFASPALAQFDPSNAHLSKTPDSVPLPYHDVRLQGDQPTQAVRASIERTRAIHADEAAARTRDIERLKKAIRGLRVSEHEFFGTPQWVGSNQRFLTSEWGQTEFEAIDVVEDFVGKNTALFEIRTNELHEARRSRDYATQHNGIRHLTFQQQIGNVDLQGCELRANVTKKGELINVSSTMLPRPTDDFSTPRISLSALDAIRVAAADMGVVVDTNPVALTAPQGAKMKQTWSSTHQFRSDVAITSELVYFPLTRDDIHPAWAVVLPEIGLGNTYEFTVDATDGTVLRRWNQLNFFFGGTEDIAMNVYTSDSPAPGSPGNATPNGFQFPFVPRNLITVTAASVVPYSPRGWIDDGINETQGNNVDAHLDLNADNSPDLPRPVGVPYRTFNFGLDTTMAPSTYRDAAVTQLFYLCNTYHDRLYAMGFDEASGNFQNDNFALGGVGNDRVMADCQDGSGTNNANFGTPSDGSSGRMQMYVFTGPNPDRDGDLDADVVFHEHSHGLSTRLVGVGTLNGTQSGGMGEGWGDYFGISLNAEASDDPDAVYCTGGYATYQLSGLTDNYYFGIRRFPYSTDLNKNPQTFADIDSAQQAYPPAVPKSPIIGNTATEVHNVGEVWCNALLEGRAGLWNAHGFVGNQEMMQLVVDGMKLGPTNPNFLDSRDGILQADLANNGGANLGILWTAFAKRGMGASATSPSGGTSSAGIVEAYDIPSLVLFTYPNGQPTQLSPSQPTTFQVNVDSLGSFTPISGTGELHYSVNGGGFTTVAMSETSANHYDATLPGLSCLDQVTWYVSTDTTGATETDPSGAPANVFSAAVYTSISVSFADNFEANLGWTTAVLGASTGAWERGIPINDPTWDYDPAADSDGSGRCFLTQNTAGNTDVDGGSVQLNSPDFDLSGGPATVGYDYYLNLTVADGVDRLLVEVSSNGAAGPWTTVATHTTSGGTSWRHNDIDTATMTGLGISLTSTMRMRFTANDSGTASICEAGLDAFTVSSLVCEGPGTSYCAGDGVDSAVTSLCPCGNFGDVGRGCANSNATLGGAHLTATGTISPNTIAFTCDGIPNNNLATFIRGTTNDAQGTVFGDGVRCVSGTTIRFGQQLSGQGGNPANTVASSTATVAAGSTRYYQVQYRNPSAGFCPPDVFNVSSGYILTW